MIKFNGANKIGINLIFISFVVLFTGCGGGSGDGGTPSNGNTNNNTNNNSSSNNNNNNAIVENNDSNVYIINQINTLRNSSGMITLVEKDLLNTSSLNHAKYLDVNNISSHDEVNGSANFTGVKPKDRTIHVGYKSRKILENLSTGQDTVDLSLEGLMGAIYHRFGFLSFEINEIGFGEQNESYVYNMGNSDLNTMCNDNNFTGAGQYISNVCESSSFRVEKSKYHIAANKSIDNNPEIVKYPYANQNEVTPVFFEESPDPLPSYSVSGYPISIEFNANDFNMSNFTVDRFILKDNNQNLIPLIEYNNSAEVFNKITDPNSKVTEHQFVIFSNERLDFNSTYSVEFEYTYDGNNHDINWSFTTKALINLIVYNNASLNNITLGEEYLIYIKPSSKLDVFNSSSISCSYINGGSATPEVSFYDKNTIKLKISGSSVNSCTLRLNGPVSVNKDIVINF